MKRRFVPLIFLVFVLLANGAMGSPLAGDKIRKLSTDSTIITTLSLVRSDSLLSYVQTLQDYGTRFLIAPNRKEIATSIMDKFISFGMTEVRLDSFQCHTDVHVPPYCDYDTITWQYNVEAKITGSIYPSSELVMMGHYDAFVSVTDPMIAAPGADDNASGVAALLECARVIMETGYQPGQTFIFLATAAEELNISSGSGARHYAEEAAAEGKNLTMVLNNDMIGWNDSSWTISLVNDTNSQRVTDLSIHVIETYTTLNRVFASLGTFCDLKYFLNEGYRGIYFMEDMADEFYPYYHTINDLADHIDTAYLAEITRTDLGCLLYADLIENDAALEEIGHVPEDNCTGLISPLLTIKNYGSDALTSMDIVSRVNEEDSTVVEWTGSLALGETQQVELPGIQFVLLQENELEITLENINGTTDELPQDNSRNVSFGLAEATTSDIFLKIKLDDHPEETTWDIKNREGEIIFNGGPYTTPNVMVQESLFFPDPGCYIFTAYDAGGDGLYLGYIALYYGTNNMIFFAVDFGPEAQTHFDVGGTIQIEEISQPGRINIYPNPCTTSITISLPSTIPVNNTTLSICNVNAQQVLTRRVTESQTVIDISMLPMGVYIAKIMDDRTVQVGKFVKQ